MVQNLFMISLLFVVAVQHRSVPPQECNKTQATINATYVNILSKIKRWLTEAKDVRVPKKQAALIIVELNLRFEMNVSLGSFSFIMFENKFDKIFGSN